MKVNLNIEKKYAYTIIGLLILVAGFVAVNAAGNIDQSNVNPDDAWHDGSQIRFDADGQSLNKIIMDMDDRIDGLGGANILYTIQCNFASDGDETGYELNGVPQVTGDNDYAGYVDSDYKYCRCSETSHIVLGGRIWCEGNRLLGDSEHYVYEDNQYYDYQSWGGHCYGNVGGVRGAKKPPQVIEVVCLDAA